MEDRIESLLTKLVTESQISVGLVVGQVRFAYAEKSFIIAQPVNA